ncbi:hypothetical protein CALVIDRAFT_345843 [Calocera viscosa TUFC12733]|uniref:Xylanolytic transcriptional activator regulatory domain-containing protein n=1 Tax=Calocera viscosa (strain TUFC12733) TaxID=1330018 RepID=A0A167HB68_CALVF|nr:hypothetical protein CALVIDRAFT_345843 [Calocera viscosa TUFC12733]
MIVQLFNYYFEHIHPQFPLLCSGFHTPKMVTARSGMLLTTVCAIAAKYYAPDTELARRTSEIAKRMRSEVLARRSKTVEIVQACLLLTVWSLDPPMRPQDDDAWILFALARSMAQDIGLERLRPPRPRVGENPDQEAHNRTRTWLHLYFRDQGLSAALGRSSSIKENDEIMFPDRYLPITTNQGDFLLSVLIELCRILSRTLATLLVQGYDTDGDSGFDYMVLTNQFENQLNAWKGRYMPILHEKARLADPTELRLISYQRARITFDFHYSMLLICSFGMRNALRRAMLDIGFYFNRCYSAAMAVLRCARHEYTVPGWLRHAPNSTFVCISYAAVSLLRFCRPKLQKLLAYDTNILDVLDSTVVMLEKASASPQHLAYQHSIVLRAKISSQTNGIPTRINTPMVRSPRNELTNGLPSIPQPDGHGIRRDWSSFADPGLGTDFDFSFAVLILCISLFLRCIFPVGQWRRTGGMSVW